MVSGFLGSMKKENFKKEMVNLWKLRDVKKGINSV